MRHHCWRLPLMLGTVLLLVACGAGSGGGTSAPQAQSKISTVVSASRTSGVAPLAVFFDTAGTSGLDGDDDLAANFTWDFGDPSSGVWPTTGKSRNAATGFLAAHVFETPGTYVVSLGVRDRAGRLGPTETLTVSVTDPAVVYAGTATRCVSRTGDFTGAPAGCDTVASTDLGAQLSWLNGAANPRLLLRRGEAWPAVTLALNGAGPNTLGAFGAGALPLLQLGYTAGQSAGMLVSGSDWRVMDLDLDGINLPPRNSEGDTAVGGGGVDFLGMNLSIHDGQGVGWGAGGDRDFLYDSEVLNNGYFSVYVDGVDSALLGSSVDQMRIAVSFIRPTESRNVYIANNLIDASRAAPTTGIKWHSRRGVITDNVITAGTSRISTTASDAECDFSLPVDQNLGRVLIERNLLKPDGNPANDNYISTGIDLTENDAMVRNNLIYDMDLAFRGACGTRNVRILNNSAYMTAGTTGLNVGNGDFLNIDAPAVSSWEVRNNLMWSENPGSNGWGELINLGTTAGITLSNNLYYKPSKAKPFAVGPHTLPTAVYDFAGWQALGFDADSLWADPQLLSVDPASADFFRLGVTSPAIGAGTPVAVFEDYDRNPRSASAGYDIGALEH